MTATYESLIFHDAPGERLRWLVETVATHLKERRGWTAATGDLPDSTGLRVPWSLLSCGERVTMAIEEKSIRIVSVCRFSLQVIDWGKNRSNVELVRRSLRQEVSREGCESE